MSTNFQEESFLSVGSQEEGDEHKMRGHVAGGLWSDESGLHYKEGARRAPEPGPGVRSPAWVQTSPMAFTSPGPLYLRGDSESSEASKFPNSTIANRSKWRPLNLLGAAKRTPHAVRL